MDAGEEGEAWLEDAEVMSEVHVGSAVGIISTVSVFEISRPTGNSTAVEKNEENLPGRILSDHGRDHQGLVQTDEHGDLVLPRRAKKRKAENETGDAIVVHHHLTTRLPQVGLQIWRGALLLSDFILHMTWTSDVFVNVTALELGSGTDGKEFRHDPADVKRFISGLAGLVMARVASLVFITDKGEDILENCDRNVIMNVSSLSRGGSTVRVRELDWQKPWPPHLSEEENSRHLDNIGPYQWNPEDRKAAEKVSILLAADVIYSEDLTRGFFEILKKLMPPNSDKVLYLAMEKRYNFSMSDLDVVAHGYKHFRTFFTTGCPLDKEPGWVSNEGEEGNEISDFKESPHNFFGKKIDVNEIPQYITNYGRGDDLELWEIRPWRDARSLGHNID